MISLADSYSVCVVPSTGKPTIISPPGYGITATIPHDAIDHPPGENPIVSIGTCSSESFVYPEGFVALTPVYQLSSDSPFKKDINLSLKHNAVIGTKEDARHMTFCVSQLPRYRSEKIKFACKPGGVFEVGGTHCNLSTKDPGLICGGSMQDPSKIGKSKLKE